MKTKKDLVQFAVLFLGDVVYCEIKADENELKFLKKLKKALEKQGSRYLSGVTVRKVIKYYQSEEWRIRNRVQPRSFYVG